MIEDVTDGALPPLRIKELREARGWTTEVLGRRVGVSPAHVSRVENGTSNTRLGTLKQFADALEVPVTDLFAGESRDYPMRDYKVCGEAGAGTLQPEKKWPKDRWFNVRLPLVNGGAKCMAMRMNGDDFNSVYPRGSMLVVCPVENLSNGDYVVVAFQRGDFTEVLVRELRMDQKGACWLWPKSDRPEYQTPIALPVAAVGDQIIGVVRGAFVPR